MVIGNVTRARVFSQTLVHGNSKIKKDKDTEEEGKKSGVNMEKRTTGTKNKMRPTALLLHKSTVATPPPSPPKQWMIIT